jgi:hypothetical protein
MVLVGPRESSQVRVRHPRLACRARMHPRHAGDKLRALAAILRQLHLRTRVTWDRNATATWTHTRANVHK